MRPTIEFWVPNPLPGREMIRCRAARTCAAFSASTTWADTAISRASGTTTTAIDEPIGRHAARSSAAAVPSQRLTCTGGASTSPSTNSDPSGARSNATCGGVSSFTQRWLESRRERTEVRENCPCRFYAIEVACGTVIDVRYRHVGRREAGRIDIRECGGAVGRATDKMRLDNSAIEQVIGSHGLIVGLAKPRWQSPESRPLGAKAPTLARPRPTKARYPKSWWPGAVGGAWNTASRGNSVTFSHPGARVWR